MYTERDVVNRVVLAIILSLLFGFLFGSCAMYGHWETQANRAVVQHVMSE